MVTVNNKLYFRGDGTVEVGVYEDSVCWDGITYSELDEKINDILMRVPFEYRATAKLGFTAEDEYECHYVNFKVYYNRPTTKEEEDRLNKGKEDQQKAKEDRDKVLYNSLKKKFEG